jgi:hypothetical protein
MTVAKESSRTGPFSGSETSQIYLKMFWRHGGEFIIFFLVMLLSTTVNIMRACRVMNIYTLLLPHRLLHSDPEDPYD